VSGPRALRLNLLAGPLRWDADESRAVMTAVRRGECGERAAGER